MAAATMSSQLLLTILLHALLVSAEQAQSVFSDSTGEAQHARQRIAIIGAGLTGATAAFRLNEHMRLSPARKITIFEKEARIGGRIKTIQQPDNDNLVLEVGASRFFHDDWCLKDLLRDVGLQTQSKSTALDQMWRIGVWDGESLRERERCDVQSLSWKSTLRRMLNGHFSTCNYRKLLLATLEQWRRFTYSAYVNDIMENIKNIGLAEGGALGPAVAFLSNASIFQHFQASFVQPCARGRFYQDLSEVRGLNALLSTRESQAVSVSRGNIQLIKRMILLSEAELRLNSTVTSISPGSDRRYRINLSSDRPASTTMLDDEFDIVFISMPLRQNDLSMLAPLVLDDTNLRVTPEHEYISVHVTHFTSRNALSRRYFNLPKNATRLGNFEQRKIQSTRRILDELDSEEIIIDELFPEDILTGGGTYNTDFIRLTHTQICYRFYCMPGDDCDTCEEQHLYRVISNEPLKESTIVSMLGTDEYVEGRDLLEYGVRWIHRQPWIEAFPKYKKEVKFPTKLEIGPKLFYLNGMENIVSSMEAACRVAQAGAEKLLWDDRWTVR